MRKAFYYASAFLAGSLLIFCAGCGAKQPATSQNQPAGGGKTSNVEEFTGTMSDLMKRGQPVHCTYSITKDNTTQKGEMFISGNKARSDVQIISPDTGTQNVHAIALGDDQYVWGAQGKMGTKITMSLEDQQKMAEQNKETYQQNSKGAPDISAQINFKCTDWSVDESQFEPPKDIQFQDMTNLFKNFTSGAATGNKVVDMCKLCNNLPAGTAKDSCIKSNCK